METQEFSEKSIPVEAGISDKNSLFSGGDLGDKTFDID